VGLRTYRARNGLSDRAWGHGAAGAETRRAKWRCRTKKGRESPEQVTLFKSVGVAVQDIAAANRVLAAAERLNLGTEVAL